MLCNKSHAYLISQNYGSSCSSFNGSSVATRSPVFRFFPPFFLTRVIRLHSVVFVGENDEKKMYKSTNESFSRKTRLKNDTLKKRKEKRKTRGKSNSRILPPNKTREISKLREAGDFETAKPIDAFWSTEYGVLPGVSSSVPLKRPQED